MGALPLKEPSRRVTRYHGGNFRVADWILESWLLF